MSDAHEHHEHEKPAQITPEDSGSQALSEALRSSFAIVKVIMIFLVIVFFGSGLFTVPPNQRAVAEFAKLDKVMTSQVTRSLQAQGLVERESDPLDSRAWLLTVTPRGQKLFAEAVVRVREVDQRFFGSKAASFSTSILQS